MKIQKKVKIGIWSAIFLLIVTSIGIAFFSCAPQLGTIPKGEKLNRIRQSPNWYDGQFWNTLETNMMHSRWKFAQSMYKYVFGKEKRVPDDPLPSVALQRKNFNQIAQDRLRVTWLGHSTVLLEIGGKTILADPVFSERASVVSFAGPKRFEYQQPILLAQLPEIDAIIISHDHYDHLDYGTIKKMHPRVSRFFVPLGVGAHLEKWGVLPEKITELDWWEETIYDNLKLAATPSRHFSGRGLMNRNTTLWSSWVIQSATHAVFFGGDSGYFPGFQEIGKQYGPFDLTLLECGAYSPAWPYVHMAPEETAQAHIDLGGKILLPLHWGKFSLSLHSWTDPIERLLRAAEAESLQVATPRPGETFTLNPTIPQTKWWLRNSN